MAQTNENKDNSKKERGNITMKLLEVLVFVVAIWGIYLTFLRIRFDKQLKIYRNLIKSWTGAKPTCRDILNIQERYLV